MTRLLGIGIWNSQLGRISVIQLLWLKYLINSKWIFLSRVLCLKIPHPPCKQWVLCWIHLLLKHPSLQLVFWILHYLFSWHTKYKPVITCKVGARKTMFSVYSRQSCMQNSQHIASQHLSSKINIKLYSLLCWQRQRPLSINTRKEVMRLTIAMAKANPLKENNSPWIYMSCIQPFWAAIPFSSMRK